MALNEKELLKRIEALEARVAALEGSKTNTAENEPLHLVREYRIKTMQGPDYNSEGRLNFNVWFHPDDSEKNNRKKYNEILADFELEDFKDIYQVNKRMVGGSDLCLLSNGTIHSKRQIGYTLREIKAFATLIGYPIPEKAKADTLAASIVRDRGSHGVCVSQGQMLTSKGTVFALSEINAKDLLKEVTSRSNAFNVPEEPNLAGKSGAEKFELIEEFFNSVSPKPFPSKAEAKTQYIAAVELFKKSKSLKF